MFMGSAEAGRHFAVLYVNIPLTYVTIMQSLVYEPGATLVSHAPVPYTAASEPDALVRHNFAYARR